jgi:hypothetical protein
MGNLGVRWRNVEPAVIPLPDDATSGGATSQLHQEYVAFKNGHLDNWGWGKLPRILKKNRPRMTLLKT